MGERIGDDRRGERDGAPGDPGGDYLIALARANRAALVSGDKHLLHLSDRIPVFSPRDFLALLSDA